MKVPARIIAPILVAVICAAGLLAALWWQLVQSTKIIQESGNLTEQGNLIISEQAPDTSAIDPEDRSLVHLRQGDVFALQGKWFEAEQEYEKSVKEGAGLPALRKLAQAQLQRRNIDGVKATIRKLKNSGAKAEDLLLLESIVDLRSGELVAAKTRLETANDSPQKSYGLALLAIVEGKHDDAQAKLATVQAGWEPVLRSHAKILQAAYDEYALFPESPGIHLTTLLSRALAQVQECEIALPLLLQVTKEQDDYRDAWIVQGYCELTTERADQALVSLEQAYSLDPQKPEIQYFLGRTYAVLNEHTNAITFFEYAIANRFEPASEVRRYIAEEALKEGRGELALEQYELLAEEEDANVGVYEGYVATSIALGKSEEAYVMANEATEKFAEIGKAYELLGWAAMETDRLDEAQKAFNKALDLDPFLEMAKEKLKEL